MHMSLATEFETGGGSTSGMARIELVQTHADSVELRVRHECVANLDRDQLLYLVEMIDKMVGHLTANAAPQSS